ncbi:hypothetical protein PTKIN_Ptkin03bG0145200 [Pterospermum kingtungense]
MPLARDWTCDGFRFSLHAPPELQQNWGGIAMMLTKTMIMGERGIKLWALLSSKQGFEVISCEGVVSKEKLKKRLKIKVFLLRMLVKGISQVLLYAITVKEVFEAGHLMKSSGFVGINGGRRWKKNHLKPTSKKPFKPRTKVLIKPHVNNTSRLETPQ